MPNIHIGLAEIDYTPQVGLPLMGNYRDDYASRGVHDPLYARAMVVASGTGEKVALLSVDICMLNRDNVSLMREVISSQCDIPPENTLIAATHTHSGPAPMPMASLPESDDAAVERFLRKAATAVPAANENLAPATLSVGHSEEHRVSFNRRLRCKDGRTHMNWEQLDPNFVVEPLGPIDPQVSVLVVEQEGTPRAALVNFALHPAVLAGDNWLYSADYPGYLAEAMSRLMGPAFITLFFNGCCGNVNHIDYADETQGRGYQMTQRIGYMLAAAVFEAMKAREAVQGETIAVSKEKVVLDRFRIPEEQRKWAEEVLERIKETPEPGQVDGLPDSFYARAYLDMYQKQDVEDEAEIMAIRVGDVGIVGLPGEIFCELGFGIKKRSPAENTLVIELSNDAIGYMPIEEAFEQGGYESTPGSTMYAKGSGEKLAASAVHLLSRLFEEPDDSAPGRIARKDNL